MTRARIFSQQAGNVSYGGGGGGANITLSALQPYLTTANVTELTNLYFSNARVFANLQLASLNDLYDVITTNKSNGQALVWTGNIWAPGNVTSGLSSSDYLPEGISHLFFTNARARAAFTAGDPTITVDWATGTIRANVAAIANSASTTDGLTEGFVNKYYTNSRVFANLQLASINDLYDVILTSPSNNQVLLYNQDTGKWINGGALGVNAFFAQYSDTANSVLSIANFTTDNLVEGANNKYLTYITLANILANVSIDKLLDVNTQANLAVNRALVWDGLEWKPKDIALAQGGVSTAALYANAAGLAYVANVANFANISGTANVSLVANVANTVRALNNFTTANLIESASNLYFTYARVNATVQPFLTTANVIETAGNLYYTNARVITAVTPLLTTANVRELGNLYYTDARVLGALANNAVNLKDLIATGNITVTGNVATLNVGNIQTTSKTITLSSGAANPTQAEGSGIYINGANAKITYGQTDDSIGFNKNITINGNVLPAISGVYNLGSPTRKFLSLYLGTQTIYLGNVTLGESPSGGLAVTTVTGDPSDGAFANLTAVQSITVDRVYGNVLPLSEFASYIGGNVSQFLSNTTGNLYIGIRKDADWNKFAGFRIVEGKGADGNYQSDILIYNDKQNTNNSTARISILGDGNLNILANVYLNTSSKFYGNVKGDLIGNVTGTVSTLFNHSTDGLKEGSNLYYTNSRVRSTLSGGTGVTYDSSAGQISIGQDVSTTANVTFYNVSVTNNLVVYGGVERFQANNLVISDNMIYLNNGSINSNPDIGFAFNYNDGVYHHAGFFRDHADGTFKVFDNYTPEPDANIFINTAHASFRLANLQATNYIGNVTATTVITGTASITGNATITGVLTARSNNGITLGTPRLGTLTSNAITMTVDTTVTDGITQLNQILGKLVPTSPPPLSTATGNLSILSVASYRICNFTQTINGPTATQASAGSTVTNVLRSNTWTSTWINDVGPGDSGTVTVYLNGAAAGSKTLATGSDNGTYGNLTIADNVDYGTKTGQSTGFWESMDLRANSTVSPPGWNEVYITHSQAGSSNIALWYNDINSPGTPTLTSNIFGPTSNSYTYSSTVPHYNSSSSWRIYVNVNKLSGDFYYSSDTFLTGGAGGAFQTPASITYTAAGITTPLVQNLYRDSGSIQVTTTAAITTGFGKSTGTGPTLTVQNGYTLGSATITPIGNVLYKTGTGSTMEESTITVGSAFGSGAATVSRIENPGSGDTPTYTANAFLFNSQTSTLQPYDATIVGATLKHDTTNYSVGHWPSGPNLSTQSSVQYFTFKAIRTSLSKFNIKYTGNIAGMWVAVPGSTIDTSSTLNGWIDMSLAYAGSGVPGAGTGGNGTNGCALGGPIVPNRQITNSSNTCTFGTVSTSSTSTNEVYVRIKLTAGQSISALSLETASN